jgi:predicted phage-related endonuclease
MKEMDPACETQMILQVSLPKYKGCKIQIAHESSREYERVPKFNKEIQTKLTDT